MSTRALRALAGVVKNLFGFLKRASRFSPSGSALLFLLIACACLFGDELPSNWSAAYPPCERYSELLKRGHMDLGVRLATSNQRIASQFIRAMDFWSGILDMEWHEDDSENCSIQVLSGGRDLLRPVNGTVAARAQFPHQTNFQGLVAFNEQIPLSKTELYMIAVHEIGHLLGLQHNPNPMSIMYYMDLEGSESLDATDVASLSALHKLRLSRSEP